MKTISIFVVSLVTNFMFGQQTITVNMTGIPTEKGVVMIGLYSEDTFMKAKPEYSATSKIEDQKATCVFKDIPAGEYAVAVFHDENENQRMDFNSNGMPNEAYGSSNNKFNPFGPPQWNDSKFKVENKSVSIDIKMNSI